MKEILSVLLLLAISTNALNREKLINAAIQDVTLSASASEESHDGTTSGDLLSAFKRASEQAIQQGNARIRFESLIRKAERSILENERLEMKDATNLAKAEEIAKILVSKPGSVLTKDEIAKIYEVEGCTKHESEKCEQSRRTVTGYCNNRGKQSLGSSGTPFRRLIPPQYEDGFSTLRGTMQSDNNSLLSGNPGPFKPPNPSPRVISLNIIQDLPIFNNSDTHLLMQWGQFVDHDLSLAPAFNNITCGCEITEKCVPIRITASDPIFSGSSENCLAFPRSIPACDPEAAEGELRPREQINELTSFMDASQVYGANQELFDAVRDPNSGRLRTGAKIPDGGGDSLPIDESGHLVECMPRGSKNCFLAGDVRVNEQTSLIVMHTIWMREHNRIVEELKKNNPNAQPEDLFQAARAIVGAEIQKITYKDYLPILLGNEMPLIKSYSGYDSNVDPSIPNSFAAAAFRFGHTQINNVFERLDKSNMPLSIGPLNLLDAFFNPSQYSSSLGTDPILRGLLQRPARGVDEFLNDVLTNHLFQTKTSKGLDLAALNIQRGRDHGLPPYLTWKRWAQHECNISSDFINDLTEVRLLQTYGTLETVDLWVGGLAETHIPGGLLGATFACIFAKTFEALRDGDRFYYENSDPNLFTADQRESIQSTSLSRVICDNADDIDTIQRNAFLAVSPSNPTVDCSSLGSVDVAGLWKLTSENWCYLRSKINGGHKRKILTFSKPAQIPVARENFTTSINGAMSACLPFICPTEGRQSVVWVVYDNDQCEAQEQSSFLQINQRKRDNMLLVRGKVDNAALDDSKSGVYRGFNACNKGTVDELTLNCKRNNPEIISSPIHSVPLLSTPNTIISTSTRLTESEFMELPKEIREFISKEDDKNKSDVSEQSWRKETINSLENLLSTLKEKQDKTNKAQDNESNIASDEELYKSLSALLKNK